MFKSFKHFVSVAKNMPKSFSAANIWNKINFVSKGHNPVHKTHIKLHIRIHIINCNQAPWTEWLNAKEFLNFESLKNPCFHSDQWISAMVFEYWLEGVIAATSSCHKSIRNKAWEEDPREIYDKEKGKKEIHKNNKLYVFRCLLNDHTVNICHFFT